MATDGAPRYWGFRTDPNRTEEIMASLADGALRQGWAYDDKLNLDLIGPLVQQEGRAALDDEQQAAWRRCQRMWPGHWDPLKEGDVLLLPKVPERGTFSLVRITGPYRYSIHEAGDLGHILPVEILRTGIANSNVHVESGLQRTLRSPIWEITAHAAAIESLLSQAEVDLASRDSDLERLERLRTDMTGRLLEDLRRAFGGNQFEAPVRRLLEVLYPRGSVDYTGGPSERGADFVVDDVDPFGFERRIVFQLKAWDGAAHDLAAVKQLRKAVETRDASEAFLLTTAEHESESFRAAREGLERELGVPVRFVNGDLLASLFLLQLPNLTGS